MFTLELNRLAGENVCFLFGGHECIVDLDDVAKELSARLLRLVNEDVRRTAGLYECFADQHQELGVYFLQEAELLEDYDNMVLEQLAEWSLRDSGDTPSGTSFGFPSVSDSDNRSSGEMLRRDQFSQEVHAEGEMSVSQEDGDENQSQTQLINTNVQGGQKDGGERKKKGVQLIDASHP